MQSNNTPTAFHAGTTTLQNTGGSHAAKPAHEISLFKLAQLDLGLFVALCKLGTSAERIRTVLRLSRSDFDYLSGLAGIQGQA